MVQNTINYVIADQWIFGRTETHNQDQTPFLSKPNFNVFVTNTVEVRHPVFA